MPPLKNRLTKKKDFENIFKYGQGFSHGFLYLKIKKNDLEFSRFGFVVSKKFSKKSIERNKIKRKLREIIRKKSPEVKKGLDAILIVNPGLENDFQKLENIINKLLKRAKIINGQINS